MLEGWVAAGAFFTLIATLLMLRFALRRTRAPKSRPPITLLKPLAGREEGLDENLRSFFEQRYPAQIVIGIRGDEIEVVERLCAEFPDRDVSVVRVDPALGANPKTSALAQMAAAAKHDLWVVTDADVKADPEFLDRVAAAFEDERVGAATALCRIPCASFASALHAYVWCLDKFAFLLVAKFFGALRFGNGCVTAIRRSILEQGGGFEAFADRIGDGYWWPNIARRAGKRVELLDRMLLLTGPVKNVFGLQLRYVREQRALEPWGHLFIPLTYGWVPALALGWLDVASIVLAIRLTHPILAGLPLRWIWLTPMRDIWSLVLWVLSYLSRRVEWRGREFEVKRGGALIEVGDSK